MVFTSLSFFYFLFFFFFKFHFKLNFLHSVSLIFYAVNFIIWYFQTELFYNKKRSINLAKWKSKLIFYVAYFFHSQRFSKINVFNPLIALNEYFRSLTCCFLYRTRINQNYTVIIFFVCFLKVNITYNSSKIYFHIGN